MPAAGLAWLRAHEPQLCAPRDRLDRIKDDADLAFVASRLVATGRDRDGVWRALAARAWERLGRGDLLVAARKLRVLPAIVEPFFALGHRNEALERAVRAERPPLPALAELVVEAARRSIHGSDASALSDEAGVCLEEVDWPTASIQQAFLGVHVVFFVWPHGAPPPRHGRIIRAMLDALLPRVLASRHVDLGAELLAVYGAAAPVALVELVRDAQAPDGMFPAFAPPVAPTADRFTWGYHSTLAALLALTPSGAAAP